MKPNKKILLNSFLVCLLYVALGTFSILASDPNMPIYWDGSIYLLWLTFPVSIIGFGLAFSGPDYVTVYLVQGIIFFIFWWIVYRIWMKQATVKFRK